MVQCPSDIDRKIYLHGWLLHARMGRSLHYIVDFETAARRELIEETGYHAASLEELLTSPSTPGMADEIITIYFASGLERVGPGGGDGNENITVHHVPVENAVEWLDARQAEGIMLDPKIYAGLFWAATRS